MIARQVCTSFDTNVQNWTGQTSWNLAESRWVTGDPKKYLHQVNLCKSLCWRKVFIVHSVLLQHSCSRSPPSPFASASPCRPITPFHFLASFPTCALKSLETIVDSLVLTFHKAQGYQELAEHHYIFNEFGVHFGAVRCAHSSNYSTGIHLSTLFVSWVLASIPTPAWANVAG